MQTGAPVEETARAQNELTKDGAFPWKRIFPSRSFPAGTLCAARDLAQRFVGSDAGDGGKVQRAQSSRGLRDFYFKIFADEFVQPRGSAVPFVPEDEAVAVAEIRVPEAFSRLGREQPKTRRALRERQKRVPVGMMHDVERFPVIHSRAAQMRVRDREAEREKKAAGGKFVFFALVSAAVFLGILGLDVGIFMISKKLADSAKHQRIFADAIAHDLKTPAIEAESMANLLALRIGDDSLRPHVMALQKKLGRLTKMLDDILIFSEISACDQIQRNGAFTLSLREGRSPVRSGRAAFEHLEGKSRGDGNDLRFRIPAPFVSFFV